MCVCVRVHVHVRARVCVCVCVHDTAHGTLCATLFIFLGMVSIHVSNVMHARDVYLGMCPVQNGVPILMY